MKKSIALLAVLLLLGGLVVPTQASAWGRGGFRGGHHFGCCHGGFFWPGAIIGGLALGAVAAATYPLWAAPPVYPVPVTYAAPPVVYTAPPVAYAPPPPTYAAPSYTAPQVQREVVYSNGRYVLYGDGVTQAWQWVWVPAAPPAPPPPPPPPQQ